MTFHLICKKTVLQSLFLAKLLRLIVWQSWSHWVHTQQTEREVEIIKHHSGRNPPLVAQAFLPLQEANILLLQPFVYLFCLKIYFVLYCYFLCKNILFKHKTWGLWVCTGQITHFLLVWKECVNVASQIMFLAQTCRFVEAWTVNCPPSLWHWDADLKSRYTCTDLDPHTHISQCVRNVSLLCNALKSLNSHFRLQFGCLSNGFWESVVHEGGI